MRTFTSALAVMSVAVPANAHATAHAHTHAETDFAFLMGAIVVVGIAAVWTLITKT